MKIEYLKGIEVNGVMAVTIPFPPLLTLLLLAITIEKLGTSGRSPLHTSKMLPESSWMRQPG